MLWSVPVAVIFAREILEACVIIGQYRTLVLRSEAFTGKDEATALQNIWICAAAAASVAVAMIVALAIPLSIFGGEMNNAVAEVVEGVSKVVAAVCIFGLSLKIPKWLEVGPYAASSSSKSAGASLQELRFNVSWNIWREVAEIGAFLLPNFLAADLAPIPLSGAVGVCIALVPGVGLYAANRFMKQKLWLAVTMSLVTGWLAAGLMAGGMHEFEEVLGETPKVFFFPGCASSKAPSCGFWNKKKLPMALLRPFGYSHSPTVLEMFSFWLFICSLAVAHVAKVARAQKAAGSKPAASKELEADQPVTSIGKHEKQESLATV
jgi:high-affinity iron transporter